MSWVFCSRPARQSTNLMVDILLVPATGRAYTPITDSSQRASGHPACHRRQKEAACVITL